MVEQDAIFARLFLQNILSGFFAPILAGLSIAMSPRRMIRLGVLIFAISFMLFSMVNALWNFYLLLLLMSVGVSLSGFMAVNTVAVNWFEARRSVALSLIQTGMSIGGLFVPVVSMPCHQGWRFSAFSFWTGDFDFRAVLCPYHPQSTRRYGPFA
ncbi:MAG: MFS transporter [Deinococcales bacterium]